MLRGLTKPTWTDRLARWTVPPAKPELNPCPVSKITFKKDHYRTAFSIDRNRQAANISSRLEFSPLSAEQELYVENKQNVRADLYKLMKVHALKCCFVELMEGKKLNRKVKLDTPTSVIERIELFECNDTKTVNESVKSFTETLKLSNSELDTIKQNTIGQAAVTDWFKQREGCLTASRFHHICTRVASLQASQSEDPTNLIASLLGYKKIPETAAMKHGKAMEPHAKSFYISAVKKEHHRFKSNEAGLVVMNSKPYIGVSPDLEIDCMWCGDGLVEIKCPYSIRDTAPSVENLPYLHMVDGKIALKTNSDYYFQVQGQVKVTGKSTQTLLYLHHTDISFSELTLTLLFGKASLLSLSGSGKTACAQSFSQKQSNKELHRLKQTTRVLRFCQMFLYPQIPLALKLHV